MRTSASLSFILLIAACAAPAGGDADPPAATGSDALTAPPSATVDVPFVLQNPELPRGCEVTSLTMLLRHAGVSVDKMTLATQIAKVPYATGGLHGDPYAGFVGNMTTFAQPGYGVYHGPVADLAARYLPGRIADLTGAAFDDLLAQHVAKGRPVWIVTNDTFVPRDPGTFVTWQTANGDARIHWSEHSVVVTGYDATTVSINDPLDANGKGKKLPRTDFRLAWEQMGRQAITYLPAAAAPSAGVTDPACTETSVRAATPTERRPMIDRALHWVDVPVPYSQTGTFDGYRTDGSGFLSMAWQLPTSRVSSGFAPFDRGVSHAVAWSDALPGDGLSRTVGAYARHHDAVFAGWADAAHTRACVVEEAAGSSAAVRVYDAATLVDYTPIRSTGAPGEPADGGRSLVGRDCSVHGDHRLHCTNTPGAAMHATTTSASPVVNHVRTAYSWFDCWSTGELHAGGNTTWYHTEGDDGPSLGWVPAVDLDTTSTFDANPTASGLPRCL